MGLDQPKWHRPAKLSREHFKYLSCIVQAFGTSNNIIPNPCVPFEIPDKPPIETTHIIFSPLSSVGS